MKIIPSTPILRNPPPRRIDEFRRRRETDNRNRDDRCFFDA